MEIRVLKDWVIDGSVHYAGTVLDTDRQTVERLEPEEIVERVHEEDYHDTMEVRFKSQRVSEARVSDVMVFTPVYRLEDATVESVLALESNGAMSWYFQRDNPSAIVGDMDRSGEARRAGVSNHLHQYQRGREVFLRGRYDAMLIVESDMIVPADALVKMAEVMEGGIDIVYAVYRFRSSDLVNIHELLPDGQPNIGQNLSVRPHLLKRAVKLGVYPCSGIGFGCTLIRRDVLERLQLRIDSRNGAHCDSYFSADALRAGFKQAADMRVVCGHIDTDGRVLWPRLEL